MNEDYVLWEDRPDFHQVRNVVFPEGNRGIAPVTIDTFTESGQKKYREGTSIKDMVEGVDFFRVVQPYESLPRPDLDSPSYNNRKFKQKPLRIKETAMVLLLAAMQYLSPAMEKAKEDSQKYLDCKEYKVETTNGKETLIGIGCKVKPLENYRRFQKSSWRV